MIKLSRYRNFLPAILTIAVIIALRFFCQTDPSSVISPDSLKLFPGSFVEKLFPTASFVDAEDKPEGRKVYDSSGKLLGYIISSQGKADHIQGYAGPTPLLVGKSPEGLIIGTYILECQETKKFLNLVKASGVLEGFNGCSAKDAAEKDVDTVTGATFTSRAVIDTVKYIVNTERRSGEKSLPRDLENIPFVTIFIGLIAAIIALTSLSKIRIARVLILMVSFVWLGLLRAELISIDLISRWTVKGIVSGVSVGILFIAALTVIVSMFFGKALYCQYICPFGAMQEFTGKIFLKKILIPPRRFAYLTKIRYALLLIIVLVLFVFPGADLTLVEPFTIFAFSTVGLSVIFLAASSILMSVFIYRPWCTFFCPTGAFFEMFRRKR